ncbi:MAG: hypothetical protein IJY67_03710 [Paludibacteraceae bacterium]|nr:hypothetical protein [Paludibacteraceae bacterium]
MQFLSKTSTVAVVAILTLAVVVFVAYKLTKTEPAKVEAAQDSVAD